MTPFIKELREHSELVDIMPTLEGAIIEAARIVAESIRNGGK